jgi:alanine dehydrogenase
MLVLGRDQVEKVLSMRDALKAVERAFRLEAQGKAIMPSKLYLQLPRYQGDFRAMPAYIEGCAGIKWVSVFPKNSKYDLPCVMAEILLSDPRNGAPLALMDGTYITKLRTGAAGGVAVKYLARKDSSVIGIIGAGTQAETQLEAIKEVLPAVTEAKVYDIHREASRKFAEKMGRSLGIDIFPTASVAEAAQADILVTTTPSTMPIVMKHQVKPGTHINAIGADARGKQELETDLIRAARVVVDNLEQASHSGEINVPLSEGAIALKDTYGTLGEIVAGSKKGRTNDQEITAFDSTGLAIQDMVCARLVYRKAMAGALPQDEVLCVEL